MARQRMVTRTVNATEYEVMCLNTNTAEVTIGTYTLGEDLDDNKALKQMKKMFETEDVKLVKITGKKTTETLYGMPEVDFIKLAKVLPPRGTKVDEE